MSRKQLTFEQFKEEFKPRQVAIDTPEFENLLVKSTDFSRLLGHLQEHTIWTLVEYDTILDVYENRKLTKQKILPGLCLGGSGYFLTEIPCRARNLEVIL